MKNKLFFKYGPSATLITMLLAGCATGEHCLRKETSYVMVQKCLRYSNGQCAHWGMEPAFRETCVEWACNRGYTRNEKGKCVKTSTY